MKENKWTILIIIVLVVAFCWLFVKRYREYRPEPALPDISECKVVKDEFGESTLVCPGGREEDVADKKTHGL